MPKSGGSEGVKICVTFVLTPCQNRETLGRRRARGTFGGFSGPPSRGQTGESREHRRGADGQSDEVARDRSRGDHAPGVRPEVALGISSSIARREFGFSNSPMRCRTTRFVVRMSTSRSRSRNPTCESHKRREVRLGIIKAKSGIPKATSGHRPPTTGL